MNIWVPKLKIVENKDPVIAQSRLAGFWKLDVRRPDGRLSKTTGWFPNLITNAGLNQIGTVSNWLQWCRVGTGNTTPTVADTALAAQVGATSSIQASTTGTGSGEAPYYGYTSKTFRFAAGTATGNLAEIGIGRTSDTTSALFSRALILDGSGTPTTLTVLSDEFLDATYEIRIYSPTADAAYTVDISGVTYDVVSRPAAAGSGYWSPGGGFLSGSVGGVYSAQPFTGTLAAETAENPNGTGSNAASIAHADYGNNDYYREATASWGLNQGNINIQTIVTNLGSTTGAGGMGRMQHQFDPVIPKTNSELLSLVFRHTWARGTVP